MDIPIKENIKKTRLCLGCYEWRMNLEMQLFLQDPDSSTFQCEPRRGTVESDSPSVSRGSSTLSFPQLLHHFTLPPTHKRPGSLASLQTCYFMIYLLLCVLSACMLMCRVHAVPTETHRESEFLVLGLEMVVSHHGRECWESRPYWYSAAHFCLFGKDHPKRHGLTLCKPPLQSLTVLLPTLLPGEHSMEYLLTIFLIELFVFHYWVLVFSWFILNSSPLSNIDLQLFSPLMWNAFYSFNYLLHCNNSINYCFLVV